MSGFLLSHQASQLSFSIKINGKKMVNLNIRILIEVLEKTQESLILQEGSSNTE